MQGESCNPSVFCCFSLFLGSSHCFCVSHGNIFVVLLNLKNLCRYRKPILCTWGVVIVREPYLDILSLSCFFFFLKILLFNRAVLTSTDVMRCFKPQLSIMITCFQALSFLIKKTFLFLPAVFGLLIGVHYSSALVKSTDRGLK